MKWAIFILIVVVLAGVASAAGNYVPAAKACQRACVDDYSTDRRACNFEYRECRNECTADYKVCLAELSEDRNECREGCNDIDDRREKIACQRACFSDYRDGRQDCNARECRNICKETRDTCLDDVKGERNQCVNDCRGVQEKEEFDFLVSGDECEAAGGFFQQLCKGYYFGIVCSQKSYCHCEGSFDYSCPSEYRCEEDFGLTVRGRGHSIPGWRTLLGENLGDVGLCVAT